MFRRKQFKRALSKHVLPAILSVAMAFQSMPATALASESQAVEETALDENAEPDSVVDDASDGAQDDSAKTTDNEESTGIENESDASVSDGQPQSEEASAQETEESAAGELLSDEETDAAETETTVEIAAEGETPTQTQTEEGTTDAAADVARIVLDDKKADAYAQADNGFTRVLAEKGLCFVTEYAAESNISDFQQAAAGWIHVEVDGETVDALKGKLTYSWVKKAAAEGETDTQLVNAFPTDAGTYILTVSMDLSDLHGLCEKVESDLTIFLTIEKADIEIVFDKTVAPGKTVGEYLNTVNESYIVRYKDKKYNVSRDILEIENTTLPMHLFVLDENGVRQPMDETERFGRDKDYVLEIGHIALTENAAANYKLSLEDAYRIEVGERRKTQVRFQRKDAGEDLIQIYTPEKVWTIDEVSEGLFADAVTDASGAATTAGGAPAVYAQDKDGAYNTVLEGVVPEGKWYTRIYLNNGNDYTVDEKAGEIKDGSYVYKPMDSDPADAGEYFIIWSYAGDDGAYEKSHSEAVRFTVDPAPIVIKVDPESLTTADFRDGMDADAVTKALSAISYHVYPLVKNETTGAMEAGSAALETPAGFWGTSYSGSVTAEDKNKTQYYVPEFILERRITTITKKGETPAVADPKTVKWEEVKGALKVSVDDADELKTIALPFGVSASDLESAAFEFRVRFTGNKVLYDNNGDELQAAKNKLLITDVTTNSANRNYLADITTKTLEDTALPVPVEGMRTENVQIVTDGIVDAFKSDNKDVLDSGAADNVLQGTLENPAAKIYDKNALFMDRASYKQAKVHKMSADGGIGDALSVSPTDDALSYTWSYATLDKYEAYLEKWDEEQRQYKDFDAFNQSNSGMLGWTDAADGTFDTFKNVGLYRLTVTYNDPEYVYHSAEAEVFFKVVRQEVLIVPAERYAKAGESISAMKAGLGNVNKEDVTIYKLPHNSMDEFEALSDDAKAGCVLPTEEEIAEYEAENGHKPDMSLSGLTWQVMRKVKDAATGLDKEPAEWILSRDAVFSADFTYGLSAHWTGSVNWLAEETYNQGGNYTTQDEKTYKLTGEDKHHESVSEIRFYDRQIYVEVDAQKVKALGHVYDGTSVDLKLAAQALRFYTDEALTEDSRLPSETVVNTDGGYNPAKINIYWIKDGKWYTNENAVYGGTYTLGLRFEGGELTAGAESAQDKNASVTYAQLSDNGRQICTDMTFTVSPRKITVTPKILQADILFAGQKADTILTQGINAEGIVEKDQKFFGYVEIAAGDFGVYWDGKNDDGTDKESPVSIYRIDKRGGYPAFNGAASYIIQTDDREIKRPANEYLRFGRKYTVKLTNELASPLKESYDVTYGTAEVRIEKRGNADIQIVSSESELSAKGIDYDFADKTYTIRPRGAVKFYDSKEPRTVIGRDGTEKLVETNIFGFRIYAPKEFMNDFGAAKTHFVYQNAVWNAGGYFRSTDEWNNTGYIDVVFPLTQEDTTKSFCITWEDGYTETFTLADLVLADDFTKAVAPKSMAFNGVASKMAVGERQQLNLKITKAQLGDVIRIRYRIQGGATKNEYISIDPETGAVTALKAGKTATTVEAYPVYKNAEGDFVPVRDSKGKEAKAASTKITVQEVTASAVKKTTVLDESVKLYFTVPDDGYRREIYVVDVTKGTEYESRKKWKPADFDRAVDDMKNGQWKAAGFAVRPVYSYAKNTDLDAKALAKEYDKKLKAHIQRIGGIEAGHEYVVYVRNVSAARTLDDGSVVALSAGGAVKSFKTTKPQVQDLELGFTVKTSDTDKKNTVTHPVNPDGTIDTDAYTVELSAKKAQLNVYGLFSDRAGGNDAAEGHDVRRYSLVPTLKEEKAALKNYVMPKLAYTVYDSSMTAPFTPGLEQSKYAQISNKGVITLKGVDLNGRKTVYIYVRDNTQHEDDDNYDAQIELTITADPASFAGKKAKMTVGQTIRLSDYLEYKDAKNKKIPAYRSCGVTITKEMLAAAKESGYEIKDAGSGSLVHDWEITAVAPNKAVFDLVVKDFDAAGSPMETTVKLTSTPIDGVKGLKVTYADNQYITINFTHSANSNAADNGRVYDYALEVKDARGKVVDKIVLSKPNRVFDIDKANAKELKNALSWVQYSATDVDRNTGKIKINENSSYPVFNYYTGTKAKTKTFAYTFYSAKLVKLSSYTISVTPLYKNQKADKTATVKAKTTNLPASYRNVDLTGDLEHRLGGYPICVNSYQQYKDEPDEDNYGKLITETPYRFISGNVYTLTLGRYIVTTRDRGCDSLTWKSSNTKVATVKANTSSYYATFKALNPGTTTISLTSKVTKKVIARWRVTVYAVKDGSSYGGDYEPAWAAFYEKILALYDPDYEGRLEVLSEDVPLVIQNEDTGIETWVSFTAPNYGTYEFKFNNSYYTGAFYDNSDGRKIADMTGRLYLERSQKIYCRIKGNGTLTVTGSELVRLTKAHTKEMPLEVRAKSNVSFTAWEDNVYTFYLNGKKHIAERKMKAGETEIFSVTKDGSMYVTCREEVAAEELKLGSHPTSTVELDKDNQVRYISFTAGTAGVYTFTCKETDGVEVQFTTAAGEEPVRVEPDRTDNAGETVRCFRLAEGEKLVIAFQAVPEITEADKKFTVSVTVAGEAQRRKIEGASITIPKGTTEIVEYVVPSFTAEKAQFRFRVTGEDGTQIDKYFDRDYHVMNIQGARLTISNSSDVKAGDSIYIQVTAGAGSTDAKDAVLTVTQVPAEPLADKASVTVENDTEQWFTFTAVKDGHYAFGVTVAERAETDTTPLHSASLDICKELFGSSDVASNVTAEKILFLKTGEKLALNLKHDTVADIVKDDGTTQAVKSDVTVSAKAVDIQRLALNEDKTVEPITAESREVRYYSFTAAVRADYTISWNAADAAKDNAKIALLTSVENQGNGSSVLGSYTKTMNAGEVCYIRVEAANAKSANPVGGTLRVTAANLSADALADGVSYPFALADKDGKGAEKIVKFTAVESGFYEIVTTVDENPVSGLPYAYPVIETADGSVAVPYDAIQLEKGETRYFTLSFSANGSEIKETKGTITIRSKTKQIEGDLTEVLVPEDIIEEYTYTIPESGRYVFKADYDEEKAHVQWSYEDGRYLKKNEKVKVTVKGLCGDADASVKLYKPEKIDSSQLNVGINMMAVETGSTQYYELGAVEPSAYSFDISGIETGKAGIAMKYARNNENVWRTLSDGASVAIAKNEKITLRVTSASVKKDASCVLDVTANRELKLGENEIHLEAGASVRLTYHAYETGYYSFNMNHPGAQLVLKTDADATVGDSFYSIVKLNPKDAYNYTLSNNGDSALDLIVIMKAVEAAAIEPGKDSPAATDVSIAAGEWAHFALKTFKKGTYTIKIADSGTGKYLKVYLGNTNATDELKKVAEGVSLEKDLNGETLLRIQNGGLQETKVTVSVTMCETQPLPEEPVTIGRNESMLVSFVAAEKNRYLVSKDNEQVTMTFVSKNDIPKTGEVKDYKEEVLEQGDKLVYRLSYEPTATDKNAEPAQTVNVKIAPVQPVIIEGESTTTTIAENDYRAVRYQFTAKEEGTYTFATEDAYHNKEVLTDIPIYDNMQTESFTRRGECYLKAGETVFIKMEYDAPGTYTLSYTMMKAATETGTITLDFANASEQQEVKFVAPRGGIYKITAAAIRGTFEVAGTIGSRQAFPTFNATNSKEMALLNKGDIVTITVTSGMSTKTAVSLRIEEVSLADALEPGKEISGLSDTAKDHYYEMRIKEKGLYAITAGGAPQTSYLCTRNGIRENETALSGTDYVELDVDDKIILKVAKTSSEKLYTLKVEKLDVVSLDGKNTEENPFTAGEVENTYYGFTTEKAFVRYTVPEDGAYYIAVQTVNDAAGYNGQVTETPTDTPTETPTDTPTDTPTARAGSGETGIQSLEKGQTVTFTFTNSMPKDETMPDKAYKEAVFRFTLKKVSSASDNVLRADETKAGTLAADESVSYQFTAAEAGRYIIRFNGSNCTLGDSWKYGKRLEKDEAVTLTISNMSEKGGNYELTVTKLTPVVLKSGTPVVTRLNIGETALYEFTESAGAAYHIYTSKVGYQYMITDPDGVVQEEAYNAVGHMEQMIAENNKLELVIVNDGVKNADVTVAIKKAEYIPVKCGEAVSGTLMMNEKAYYAFASEDEYAAGTEYSVLLDNDKMEFCQLRVAEMGEDGKLQEPTPLDEFPVRLKKGDKLLMQIMGKMGQSGSFGFTVEKTEITYEPIELNETKTGVLGADEKAGYEFIVADAAEYSVFKEGSACTLVGTRTVTEPDGTVKEEVFSDWVVSGSNVYTWKKGDKIRFVIDSDGKYGLTVKKLVYEPLTLGTAVSKTLRVREQAYYQFTSQDAPETGAAETVYHVDATADYTVKKVTVNEDGTTTTTYIANSSEYHLKQGQSLRFYVSNRTGRVSTFQLMIKKAAYTAMTLGKTVEGRLQSGTYARYQFTSQDEPAEGETTTKYNVYGNAQYTVKKVTKNEDGTVTAAAIANASEYDLEKGQSLQFTVSGSGSTTEGYDLTIVKCEERTLTVGSLTETGSLGKGQRVVYAFSYQGENPADYVVNYRQKEDITVTLKQNGSALAEAGQKITLSKGDKLTIAINAAEDVDNFAFSLSRFVPKTMTLGTATDLEKLSAGENADYKYTVEADGSYVISMIESSSGVLSLNYEIIKADGTDTETGTVSEGVGKLEDLKKDDVVLFRVASPETAETPVCSFRLLLQKAAEDAAVTALPWSGTLKPGEVKQFRFTIPETEKEDTLGYFIFLSGSSDKLKYICSDTIVFSEPGFIETTADLELVVSNTSMYSEVECEIAVRKKEPLGMGTYTGTLAPGEYKYFTFPGTVNGEEVNPYYFQKSGDNKCVMEKRDGDDKWVSYTTGMNSSQSPYVVRVRNNNTAKEATYTFTLKNAWRDEITGAFQEDYTLEKYEHAYFKITAPEDKGLFVSISNRQLSWYSGATKGNVETRLDKGGVYGMAAGETRYFRVVNGYEDADFTMNVTETLGKVPLELNIQATTYIPAGENAQYEFEAPEEGTYIVIVEGTIGDTAHQYLYQNGTEEEKEFVNNQTFDFAAGDRITLRIMNQNTGKGSRRCSVQMLKVTAMDLNAPKEILFETYGDVYCLALPAEAAGDYTINGQVEALSEADFWVRCLNDSSSSDTNIYHTVNRPEYGNKDLPVVPMEAGETIYIKVWPYFAASHSPSEPLDRRITITVTMTPAPAPEGGESQNP